MNFVVPFDGELVAFGREQVGFGDGSQIAIWTSGDGISWINVPTRGSSIDTYQTPTDGLVAPDGRLVIATTTGLGGGSAIWMSSDGENWKEYPFRTDGNHIDDLATSGSRVFAVGTEQTGPPFALEPAAWMSMDGELWAQLDAPPDARRLAQVTFDEARDRFIVVGERTDGRPGSWLTTDGTSWASSPLADSAGQASTVASRDGLVVAIGLVGEFPSAVATAWSSNDGVTWLGSPLADAGELLPDVVGVSPHRTAVGEHAR
jgi:hypothetical protein